MDSFRSFKHSKESVNSHRRPVERYSFSRSLSLLQVWARTVGMHLGTAMCGRIPKSIGNLGGTSFCRRGVSGPSVSGQ